ncbi:MAG: hypothetical protein K8R74_12195 [Bacteroidales bacterium]|nr:hypothetical protein [Bacteroidales bacterium]
MDWKPLLKPDDHKKIIMDSLKFLTLNKRIFLYGFVIMPNHIHLLWRMQENNELQDVQRDFLKFTAQQIKFRLIDTNPFLLAQFRKSGSDREYQFWQRNSYNIRMYNRHVFEQKLDYIHLNPLQERWQLAENPEDYYFSSAKYYIQNIDEWGFITHYHDHIY